MRAEEFNNKFKIGDHITYEENGRVLRNNKVLLDTRNGAIVSIAWDMFNYDKAYIKTVVRISGRAGANDIHSIKGVDEY